MRVPAFASMPAWKSTAPFGVFQPLAAVQTRPLRLPSLSCVTSTFSSRVVPARRMAKRAPLMCGAEFGEPVGAACGVVTGVPLQVQFAGTLFVRVVMSPRISL